MSPVSISQYRLDPEQPLGLAALEPCWHCGEERKLSKADKWPILITFSFEPRTPGREWLISGSRGECQQAFRQGVEPRSCLLCIMRRKKEKMFLHFIEFFKSEKSVVFFWHCLSLFLSELSGEPKSDLHSKSKGHPTVPGRFSLFEGRVFSVGL